MLYVSKCNLFIEFSLYKANHHIKEYVRTMLENVLVTWYLLQSESVEPVILIVDINYANYQINLSCSQ